MIGYDSLRENAAAARRLFLQHCANGFGGVAAAGLLASEGVVAPALAADASSALTTRPPHLPPRAKNCIFIFLEGAPSQLDLFDRKPRLLELHGQPMPESLLAGVRFAFLKPETALLMGPQARTWARHGECGLELSDLLPNLARCADALLLVKSMHTDQFNHHPGQLLMQCGRAMFGLPAMGSWVMYGLGSESQNLPGYVVLNCGRGSSGGASLWSSGFLPSTYAGVLFRSEGEPVLNLANPDGLPQSLQREGLDVLGRMNRRRFDELGDPEIASRIANYELAFRMQTSAPELLDLSGETRETLEAYGVDRPGPDFKGGRGGGPETYGAFARNCLLARRLVERGVRFVNLIHASWDHHSNLDRELAFNAGMADQPVAALIQDLKQRGLLDDTLVVWASEFGRTPLGENRNGDTQNVTGRDHHPYAFSIFLAGGGVRGGQTWGETDDIGWSVTRDPVHINDLQATLLHLFGLDHLRLTHRHQGRDFRLTDVAGNVIDGWLA
ncbi:MAG: DUF1501 domain-containing protein [Planctomyces sp.]|nr:DUF1501 domain-containing protein [Planctomyces sp.]